MEIHEDRWLSSIFGYGVFKIEVESPDVAQDHDAADICDRISRHASQQDAAMYYAKVDTNQVAAVWLLGTAGLYVVDVNVTFGIETRSYLPSAEASEPPRYSVREIRREEHQPVLDIAASCFRYSRFHLDPKVPKTTANRVKHDWILNYIRGQRGEKLFVALVDRKPAGFLAVLTSKLNGMCIRTIDLIGVSNAFQNQGIGRALVRCFIQQHKDQSDYLQVGTQVANVPSMRLYQKLDFAVTKSQFVMHMHVRK